MSCMETPSKMSCLIFTILQNYNHFCFNINLGNCVLSFWYKGPIRGKKCIQIYVPTKPSSESWERSHLCWSHDGIYKFRWLTQTPSFEERDSCLEWTEPRDPTWKANTYYLCATKVQQAIGMCGCYMKTVQNMWLWQGKACPLIGQKSGKQLTTFWSCSPKFPRVWRVAQASKNVVWQS